MNRKVINILCLHGYKHNAELLEKSMEMIIQKFKQPGNVNFTVKFHFCNSEILVEPQINKLYCWGKEPFISPPSFQNSSVMHIVNIWNKFNFDGILGFSQGSIMAQIFYYYIKNKIVNVTNIPQFLILASTYKLEDELLTQFVDKKISCPVALIFGIRDKIKSIEKSIKVIENITNYMIIVHDGGHYFSDSCDTYWQLKKFLKNLYE